MDILRTPESFFVGLQDYSFEPHYMELGGLRLHYLDEGPADADPIVLLHGEPTWSYLYRKMIPPLAAEGYRVLAPDLIGFGKSDKPKNIQDHSYQKHVDWIGSWLNGLDLQGINLFVQDWGSLIGLRLAGQAPDQFASICVANGFLPTGERSIPFAFRVWRFLARASPWFPVDRVVAAGCARALSDDVRRAYRAPFPSSAYMAGARALPGLVPLAPNHPESIANRAAWQSLRNWHKPFLTLFGTKDPIFHGADEVLQRDIPGAADQPHGHLSGGHFVQEDCGEELAARLLCWLNSRSDKNHHEHREGRG